MSKCPTFKKNSLQPYYKDKLVTLYHGDCREVLPQLDIIADFVLVDPPYGTGKLGGGYGRRQLWGKNGFNKKGEIKGDDDLQTFAEAWPLIIDKVNIDAWLCVFFGCKKCPEFIEITKDVPWFGEVIWDKKSIGLGYHIRYAHENIAVFKRGEAQKPDEPIPSILRSSVIANVHPHEKPLDVLGKLVEFATKRDQLILDPFVGSGTTLLAAKFHRRRAIGIEIDETYCKETARRLEQQLLGL